jgi:hypothetical protein
MGAPKVINAPKLPFDFVDCVKNRSSPLFENVRGIVNHG